MEMLLSQIQKIPVVGGEAINPIPAGQGHGGQGHCGHRHSISPPTVGCILPMIPLAPQPPPVVQPPLALQTLLAAQPP